MQSIKRNKNTHRLLLYLNNYIGRLVIIVFIALVVGGKKVSIILAQEINVNERRLPVNEYRDKMMAGWIGQMVGVGWGTPTEFRYLSRIIPEDEVPVWNPGMINAFWQDDLYVEMTFLRTLEVYGLDVSIRQAGIDFANSEYLLWHANKAGRDNLRKGIKPPDCSHPQFSDHTDDIDYQIEADYSGLIAPGLPNTVITLGEKFGRLMNYGDGLYAGQFVGAMYAEAFFEENPRKIIEAGLRSIPQGSQYAEMVRDVLQWNQQNPLDWQKTWQLINEKYHKNPDYRRYSCSGSESIFNIDAKINGAYILMGLLYGGSDLDKTTIISMRCGQDSDCNPSNAAGVLFTAMGYSNLPQRFTSELDRKTMFWYTEYDFSTLVDVCEDLARQAVVRAGGRIDTVESVGEIFVIPVVDPIPSQLVMSWDPGPIADSCFTEGYKLSQNFPNPFKATTTIRYQMPESRHVTLVIFNIIGQEVRRIVDAEVQTGYFYIDWDGRNDHGKRLPSGVYLLSMRAGKHRFTRKLLLLQ